MNVERLHQLRDYILAHPGEFWMADWGRYQIDSQNNYCNTVGCIAGTAVFMFDGRRGHRHDVPILTETNQYSLSDAPNEAMLLLGLTQTQKVELFQPPLWLGRYDEIWRDREMYDQERMRAGEEPPLIGHNNPPDELDTVEKMARWAHQYNGEIYLDIYLDIEAPEAARAIDGLIEDGFVNWAKAIDPKRWEYA